MRRSKLEIGFTLIELLIVVAIIGILAAIAVPNFLQAQTRAKVARMNNDMRTLALVMELYLTDNNAYPPAYKNSWVLPYANHIDTDLRLLTTPIEYLNTPIPFDVFRSPKPVNVSGTNLRVSGQCLMGTSSDYYDKPINAWMSWSYGPDKEPQTGGFRPLPFILQVEALHLQNPMNYGGTRYDPTNGTVSYGDIYRFSPVAEVRGW